MPKPYTLENVADAYGILVEGESMEPAFEAGDIAWVNPVLGPRKGHDVVVYLVDEDSGERRAMIKRLVSYNRHPLDSAPAQSQAHLHVGA